MRDYFWESTISKPATSAVPTALFFFWKEVLNALLLGQSVSKPDLVAVSCVFIKQG